MERSSQFQLHPRREHRFRRRREYETRLCAAETAQQREVRLARRRLRDRARRAAQPTAQVREIGFQHQRLASETQEHRPARLRTISGRGWPLRHRRREQLVCCRLWLSPTKCSTTPPVCVAPSSTQWSRLLHGWHTGSAHHRLVQQISMQWSCRAGTAYRCLP